MSISSLIDNLEDSRALKFFGAVLLAALLFGGGIIKFLGFSEEVEARHDKLSRSIFTPYWSALREDRFRDAAQYRTDSWNAVFDHTELEESYSAAKLAHGKLKQPKILMARGLKKPGKEQEFMAVDSQFEFEGGWTGIIHYEISRDKPGLPWRIEASHPDEENPLGEGHY